MSDTQNLGSADPLSSVTSQDPLPAKNGDTTKDPPDLSKLYSKALSDGESRATRNFHKDLADLGIEIPEGSNVKDVLAALITKQPDKAVEVEETKKILNSEIEKWKEKYNAAQSELKNYISDSEINKVLASKQVVDANSVLSLFKAEYKIEYTKDGVHVYNSNGHLMLNEQANPMGLNEAMDKFLSQKPFLVKADARGSGAAATNMLGSPGNLPDRYANATPEQKKAIRASLGYQIKQ